MSNGHELFTEAGTELQIENNIWTWGEGRFTAQGTAENPVLIRRPPGSIGAWIGILAEGGLVTPDHTIVEGAETGLFINADGIARVRNSLFSNNEEWGIRCRDLVILGEMPVLEIGNNVNLENNGLGNIAPNCPN